MAKVTNVVITLQSGTDNTFFATWDFNETTKNTSTTIKAGDTVSIKSGAKYYNGVTIPSSVMSRKFKVKTVSGNRAVLGGSTDGYYKDINSPVNTNDLIGGSGSSSTVSTNNLDHYEVAWHYHTGQKDKKGNNIWFEGGSSDVTAKQSQTYSPPANATSIRVRVKPVSKKYKSGNTEKSYWTGENVYQWYSMAGAPPEKPGTPSVEIEKYTLTASLENISDARTDKIQFQIYDGTTKFKTGTVTVQACRAAYSCTVTVGGKYRVRCRSVNINGSAEVYSEWSDFSSEATTIPAAVTNVKCSADSETSVKVTWTASSTATEYEIQYTTKTKYFDTSSQVSSANVEGQTTAYITGLESGHTWYFRVRAKNNKVEGYSGWSSVVSAVIGTVPEAPTTWSLTNTVIVGNDVTLYWVHNSEDRSKMTEGQIQLDIAGSVSTITVPGTTEEDEDEPIYSYTFNPGEYTEGAEIKWKVRTKGIVSNYSEWSTQRSINLYAQPTVELGLSTNEEEFLTSLPLSLSITSGPVTQSPISYHVSITSRETYESVDSVGSTILVGSGSELYSKVIVTSDRELTLDISAGDVMFQNGQIYDVTVIASMDSGLTAETTEQLTVNWTEYDYTPDASIGIDFDTLSAYITPYCKDSDDNFVEDVTLSIYRREFNGTFTEIATGVANTGVDTVTDPHPSLDYARYRIIAQSISTGAISYEDLPGEPVQESSIVVQWDEEWTDFDYVEENEPETKPWTGSMIRLPYNINITENYAPDVSLVNYIGREHPVSYFGTHRGESASWSAVIDKTDKEMLYSLRRLAAWRGNVYVREPSGTGYWAHIAVSFPQTYDSLTISVTFNITRVEGGI